MLYKINVIHILYYSHTHIVAAVETSHVTCFIYLILSKHTIYMYIQCIYNYYDGRSQLWRGTAATIQANLNVSYSAKLLRCKIFLYLYNFLNINFCRNNFAVLNYSKY